MGQIRPSCRRCGPSIAHRESGPAQSASPAAAAGRRRSRRPPPPPFPFPSRKRESELELERDGEVVQGFGHGARQVPQRDGLRQGNVSLDRIWRWGEVGASPPPPPLGLMPPGIERFAVSQVQKRPYKECAGEKVPNITSECVGLRETYFNCKRGQACVPPPALNHCRNYQLC